MRSSHKTKTNSQGIHKNDELIKMNRKIVSQPVCSISAPNYSMWPDHRFQIIIRENKNTRPNEKKINLISSFGAIETQRNNVDVGRCVLHSWSFGWVFNKDWFGSCIWCIFLLVWYIFTYLALRFNMPIQQNGVCACIYFGWAILLFFLVC